VLTVVYALSTTATEERTMAKARRKEITFVNFDFFTLIPP
jgi:hypothetical protein